MPMSDQTLKGNVPIRVFTMPSVDPHATGSLGGRQRPCLPADRYHQVLPQIDPRKAIIIIPHSAWYPSTSTIRPYLIMPPSISAPYVRGLPPLSSALARHLGYFASPSGEIAYWCTLHICCLSAFDTDANTTMNCTFIPLRRIRFLFIMYPLTLHHWCHLSWQYF
ncbi:hypothetical protein PENSPDRAFT_749693 [Peniophora sp. CONT]|nr:hypothetical protein PENSPDRAFT_749693 [Peniophora sp. CONT]